MPSPSTVDEFVELVRKSELVDGDRLSAHLDRLRRENAIPAQPTQMAGIFVRDGLLTHFQAEQLLQGKWRRFTIGKYKVLERLGAGGMGSVYLCEHQLMRRRVAVKVLPSAKASDPAALDRFYREARAVAALDHPNIVRAYDIDSEGSLHFLVMEHVDGASLQEMVKRTEGEKLDSIRGAHYIRQAALGLEHAFESAGLVHRDIKPGNILVDRHGIVKILDMGLARFFHDEDDIITKKYDENVLGTADYLAPEQALDSHNADIRADIYSLGATFYFCLTGRTPFAEGTIAQKLIWHQTRQPRSIREISPEVPSTLIAIIDRMMAKDREQRFQSPQEVADALSPWTQTPIPPPPEREMPQLSLAAKGSGSDERLADPGSKTPKVGSGVKKNWQVKEPNSTAPPSPTKKTQKPPEPQPESPPPAPVSPAPAPPAPVNPPAASPAPARVEAPPKPEEAPRPPASPAPVPAAGPNRPQSTPLLQAMPVEAKPLPAESSSATEVGEEAPWEDLAPETDDLTARLDTRPSTARPLRGANPESEASSRFPWLLVVAGALLLVGTGTAAWLILRGDQGKGPGDVTTKPERKQRTLYVGGEGSSFQTIGAALTEARPGDRVVVRKSNIFEQLDLRGRDSLRNVTLEAAPGTNPVWLPPPPGARRSRAPLLFLSDIEGFQIKGFRLDGGNDLLHLIVLTYSCPGVALERLELTGFTKAGIFLSNCEGTSKNKLVLRELRADVKGAPAIFFNALKSVPAHPVNDHILVEDCAFRDLKNAVKYSSQHEKLKAIGQDVQLQKGLPRPK